jgi:transcriptional regulator with XRE-family HTH domain
MQAFSVISKKPCYTPAMPGGRPAKSSQRTGFGKRLYEARIEKGLSQTYIANQLGITQPSYADWERKAVSLKPEYLPKLAQLLDVSTEHLLGSAPAKRKSGGPTGKLRHVFDQVNELPHSQQRRIISMVEDMLIARKAKKAS